MLKDHKEIVKHSAAIQIQNMVTLIQRKAWNVLFTNAYRELPIQKIQIHSVNVQELMEAIKYESRNDRHLKDVLEELASIKVKWNFLDKDGENDWGVASLLAEVRIKSGVCMYAFIPTMRLLLHSPNMYAR